MPAKKRDKKADKPKAIELRVVPGDAEHLSRLYSNFCLVSWGNYDVMLTFCDVEPLTPKQQEELIKGAQKGRGAPVVEARPLTKIAMPVKVAKGLRDALDRVVGEAEGDEGGKQQ